MNFHRPSDVPVCRRTGEGTNPNNESGPTRRDTTRRKWSKKRGSSGESQSTVQALPIGYDANQIPREGLKEDKKGKRQPDGRPGRESSTQEDSKTKFYADYRKVTEEYDKELLKKYDEDLNTTATLNASSRFFRIYEQPTPVILGL